MLSNCGGFQSSIGAPGTMQQSAASTLPQGLTYQVLYRFRDHGRDGARPQASLIDVNGTLYGTTQSGGAKGRGTVFSVTTTGTEKVLHSFGRGFDGFSPFASLVNVNGTLYGTTESGGANDHGTVFSVTTDGTEKVLYSFGGGSDGADPTADLVNVKGTLYGTTLLGGSRCSGSGCGTVFSITTAGEEKVLYSFGGGSDGASPIAGLVNVTGTLYGTTGGGGTYCITSRTCGTVFSVTTAGTEKVLHRFAGGSDGILPAAGLVDVKDILYGTTESGGGNGCGAGCGIVYSISTGGTEKVLYSFRDGSDGADPVASLIEVGDRLYGTTDGYTFGSNGTIFSVTTTGREKVLYNFGGGTDGADPGAALISVNGTLYGTTSSGGGYGCKRLGYCGTVFALTP